jgi:hypothetical protein
MTAGDSGLLLVLAGAGVGGGWKKERLGCLLAGSSPYRLCLQHAGLEAGVLVGEVKGGQVHKTLIMKGECNIRNINV